MASKEIKMTYRELWMAHYTIFGTPAEVTQRGPMPGIIDRRRIPITTVVGPLRRWGRQINAHLEDFEKQREAAIKQIRQDLELPDDADVWEDKNVIPVAEKAIDEIMEQEMTLTGDRIPLAAFDREGFEITMREINALGPIVED